MREALIRKRFGVPALLLIVILLTAGIVVAGFVVKSITFTARAEEPLTFDKTDELDIKYQGESDNIVVEATNKSESVGYGIFVNNSVVAKQVESVSYSITNQFASEPAQENDFNGDGDMVDAKYNIGPDSSFEIVVTIDSADNAALDNVEVTLEFYREHEYEE